jgi:hypothetical protein
LDELIEIHEEVVKMLPDTQLVRDGEALKRRRAWLGQSRGIQVPDERASARGLKLSQHFPINGCAGSPHTSSHWKSQCRAPLQ